MPKSTPKVPVGIGTISGIGATATMWLVALVTALLNGDHSDETRTTLIVGGATLVVTLIGRFSQAAIAIIQAKYLPDNADTFETDPDVPGPEPALEEGSVRTALGEHPEGNVYDPDAVAPEGAVDKPSIGPVGEGQEFPRANEGRFSS